VRRAKARALAREGDCEEFVVDEGPLFLPTTELAENGVDKDVAKIGVALSCFVAKVVKSIPVDIPSYDAVEAEFEVVEAPRASEQALCIEDYEVEEPADADSSVELPVEAAPVDTSNHPGVVIAIPPLSPISRPSYELSVEYQQHLARVING